MREGVAEMSTNADALQARLNGQGGMLLELAATLRFRRPKLTPTPPEGFVEPATALAKVDETIVQGDAAARLAADRGALPALLPSMSARLRGFVVYGVAALLILAVQLVAARPLLRSSADRAADPQPDPSAVKVLFVLPMIGFVVAYLVLKFGSRGRLPQPAERSSTRLGLLLCLGIGPLAIVAYIALAQFAG
jgi:hypothetical protein